LYIVVFKGREQFRYEMLEYWLDTIRSRAPGVEVVLVATECELKLPHVPLDRLKAQYPALLQNDPFFFPVGCADNKNIPDLKEHLKKLAARLELVGKPWPKNYADSEKAIKAAAQEKAHCTRKELYDLFKDSAVNKKDFNRLAAFLGDTGMITHFPGVPELEDFIVLRPQWLTKAISHVLEHEHLVKNFGECTMDWLRGEWEHEYPELYLKFYYCMKEFELCYPLEDIPRTNLVPLRFSYAKPPIPWSEIPGAKERRIQYRFNITPPAGSDINRLALMELAAFLEKQKPANYKAQQWGELERVKLPDNTFRWLCKEHRDK
jgi:internalin A